MKLDTLFMVAPLSWTGRLEQYAGRIQRDYVTKASVQIYDYVDEHVDVLQSMFEKRKKGYRKMGYEENVKDEQMKLF